MGFSLWKRFENAKKPDTIQGTEGNVLYDLTRRRDSNQFLIFKSANWFSPIFSILWYYSLTYLIKLISCLTHLQFQYKISLSIYTAFLTTIVFNSCSSHCADNRLFWNSFFIDHFFCVINLIHFATYFSIELYSECCFRYHLLHFDLCTCLTAKMMNLNEHFFNNAT